MDDEKLQSWFFVCVPILCMGERLIYSTGTFFYIADLDNRICNSDNMYIIF